MIMECQESDDSRGNIETRPDTRPPVADGWAGAEMQLSAIKNVLNTFLTSRLVLMDGWTDKASYRVACPQLKRCRRVHE